MTQRRSHPDAISNYFDDLMQGIGKRGSTFTDIDAVTHDADNDRFLFQEFKQPEEQMHRAQKMTMSALCRRGSDFITVWCVRRRRDGLLEWCDVATREYGVITVKQYQDRLRIWWANKPQPPTDTPAGAVSIAAPALSDYDPNKPLTWEDIPW